MSDIVTVNVGRSTWQGPRAQAPVVDRAKDHVYTRVEVIDSGGRYLTHYGVIRASSQDGDRTLKIFVEGRINV